MQPRQIPSSSSSLTEGDNSSMILDNEMNSTSITNSIPIPISPFMGSSLTFSKIDETRPITPPIPIKFATSSNAFGLNSSTSSSSNLSSNSISSNININTRDNGMNISSNSSGSVFGNGIRVDISPPFAGSITTRRLRRPSMLSLQQNISFSSDNSSGKADDESTPMVEAFQRPAGNSNTIHLIQDPSSSKSASRLINPTQQQQQNPINGDPFNANTIQPTPRWPGHGGSFAHSLIRRTSSAPSIPFEDLKASTPPITSTPQLPDSDELHMDMEDDDLNNKSPLKWAPSHLQMKNSRLRKGKAKMENQNQAQNQNQTQQEDEMEGINSLPNSPTKTKFKSSGPSPFVGKTLPNALRQTLESEERPLDHEMQSEARLQRFLLSHPTKLPFINQKIPKGSRGRFPDQVGGDDDDDEDDGIFFPSGSGTGPGSGRRSISWTTTRKSRDWMDRARFDDDSDTESDEDDEEILMNTNDSNNINNGTRHNHTGSNGGKEEPVINAFAAGMDMDRPRSSSSSSINMWNGSGSGNNNSNSISEDSGKSTPPNLLLTTQQSGVGINTNVNPFPTPPSSTNNYPYSNSHSARLSFSSNNGQQGMVPSPGYGLPSAFGGLGMGGNGIGTPLGSPTVERSELGASPSTSIGVGSPGLMLYRESQGGQATVRPGKRKAQAEDRFDPYKRPRGTSPSLLGSSPFPSSPSRTSSIPIPQSPSHLPLYPSTLSSLSNSLQLQSRHTRPTHPYTRPMSSRSRAASPALSIGSGNGLSSSLGNNNNNNNIFRGEKVGVGGIGGGGNQNQQQLGGLGLLSLQNVIVDEEDEKLVEEGGREKGGVEMLREDSGERMEED